MDKDFLDLDFSEISTTQRVEAPTPPPVPSPQKEELVKPLGISIALEYTYGDTKCVELKDLAELTGEEFLTWAARVFPVLDQKSANPRDYDSRAQKASAFEHILKFHTHSLFQVKKETPLA